MLGAAPSLRTAAIGCRLQPSILISCTYTTSSPSRTESSPDSKRPVPLAKRNVSFLPTSHISHAARSASTTAAASSAPADVAAQSSHLDWNTFFKLRKTRRWFQLGSSVTTSIGGFALGAQVLSRSDMDAIVGQIPLDPMVTLGLITMACGGTGWLAGPSVGTGVFNWRNRKFRAQMDEKETEFYRRIKRFRVDPSNSSMANPVPDYYGEKISSVAGYRQWLKDCRAFNRKRMTYLK